MKLSVRIVKLQRQKLSNLWSSSKSD